MKKAKFNKFIHQLPAIVAAVPDDKEILNVLMNSTRGPWKERQHEDGHWQIVQTTKEERTVCGAMTKHMNNYDRRLMAWASALAWEVLRLRAEIRAAQEPEINIEIRKPLVGGFDN